VGLLKLRGLKWRTIAQDESSSVVWGMPKAAVEIGAAEEILPLSEIAEAIERLVGKDARSISGVSATAATAAEKL
jgi:chemotaxis response regulator CheB